MKKLTRAGFVLTPLILALVALSGCAAPEASPAAIEYGELGSSVPLAAKRAQKIVNCLDDHGFPDAVIEDDGSINYSIRKEQGDQLSAAMETCNESVCPQCDERPSDARLRHFYQLHLEAKKCLESEGFTISNPPSEQKYLEDYGSQHQWVPWGEIAADVAKSGQLQSILEKCPDPTNFVTF